MNSQAVSGAAEARAPMRPGVLGRAARRLALGRLARVKRGVVEVIEGTDRCAFGKPDAAGGLSASITVRDPRFYRELALGGELGAAEAYVRGWWSCDDLTILFRIFARDLAADEDLDRGVARLATWAARVVHRWRDNTRQGSRENIRAHYDLGNDFFALVLDETLTYSCAVFERPEATLEEAQRAKLDRVCRKLALRPDDHVIEIGTGWGSFAIHAAVTYGCRVTTTTVSSAQHDTAVQRVRDAGLSNRVRVLLTDYRDLTGTFDKLVSIEMIEAVGERHLDSYFQACARLLRADGVMLLQAIVMADQGYDEYRRSVDFIQRYVFPGGFLPSMGAIVRSVTRSSDMRLVHLDDLTAHYVTTLRMWRNRFLGNCEAVRRLGYAESVTRLWQYYLAYCEAGFAERRVGDVQLLLARAGCRRDFSDVRSAPASACPGG
jgi:cyclopropane-fatty-acyl-phospholipid synthase